ncbi:MULTISPECIES: GDSL-type esterase/lipase family protein [Comamonas]|uniref:SGNH/GDSL hydrolase family protein n=1 Tax=Comamonas TaxID=283 RepID=UPI0001DA68D6|nr:MULTISPECIES: GDSL-type esterase/lipase family protein [Comamonas]EFI60752.1 flagellar biosynthesis, cell-distal portion of basal-body rod [Comamonas thiooxydans]TFF63118.1 SGNH/GDSL hydrolase family protein [Comamonas sp. A23]
MSKTQLARGIWANFANTENPFGVPNGMEANLRLIDDHLALYTLAGPVPPTTALPTDARQGAGQIFSNGTYAVLNVGVWQAYPARIGLRAIELGSKTEYVNIGTGWQVITQKSEKSYLTLAVMLADTAQPVGTQGVVTNDPGHTPAAPINGVYTWTGSAWVRNAFQPANQEDVAEMGMAVDQLTVDMSSVTESAAESAGRIARVDGILGEADPSKQVVYAVADAEGNAVITADVLGHVEIPDLGTNNLSLSGNYDLGAVSANDFAFAITDAFGHVSIGVLQDGTPYLGGAPVAGQEWREITIGSDDTIVHIGDSYTAAHYVLRDKAYISQLSALSPYRHMNFGVSGDDALDMQYRIVNRSPFDGIAFDAMKARYAFITSLTNDGQFRSADLTYYAENIRRLIETARATGAEPVVTTEFPATSAENALLRRIADEYGCSFIDCTVLDAEVGGLKLGPFHQGHPGTRTGGVFWLPMLDFIDRMPKPDRGIKIFRRRSTFAVGSIADLLYKDRVDRNARWKEISVAHYLLDDPGKFEELSQLGTFGYQWQADEYQRIAAGVAVPFADYALLEITLPGTAVTLDAVELSLVATGMPTIHVRNFLDVPASMPGRRQGSSPTNATYLSKWDKPRGAWRSLGVYAKPVLLAQDDLKYSMQGDKLIVLVSGATNLSGLKVRYKGRAVKSDLRLRSKPAVIGTDLLAQPLCGTVEQLAAWVQTGAPSLVVPIDRSNAPRKPGTDTPADGVCVISSSNTIGQAIALPADGGRVRKYLLTVWARYFPKAFLNPSLYPGLDPAQIIDRMAVPGGAPITPDTSDLRTLKAEIWSGGPYPGPGGAEFFDFAPLQWRPVEFVFEAVPYRTGANISFRLSCPDGEIQVGKASFCEVI